MASKVCSSQSRRGIIGFFNSFRCVTLSYAFCFKCFREASDWGFSAFISFIDLLFCKMNWLSTMPPTTTFECLKESKERACGRASMRMKQQARVRDRGRKDLADFKHRVRLVYAMCHNNWASFRQLHISTLILQTYKAYIIQYPGTYNILHSRPDL